MKMFQRPSMKIALGHTVGTPVAVNPDPALRAHARENEWKIRDFRRREQFKRVALPAAAGAGGIAVGLVMGYAAARARQHLELSFSPSSSGEELAALYRRVCGAEVKR